MKRERVSTFRGRFKRTILKQTKKKIAAWAGKEGEAKLKREIEQQDAQL